MKLWSYKIMLLTFNEPSIEWKNL